jgi:oxygen-independent coproporphyrinogen-3 oxidase
VASIYIHIPWCAAKCPYCDFNTYAATTWPEARYATALIDELASRRGDRPWCDATVETVFFGGGTPSLFAPASIARIVDGIAAHWSIADDVEITMEANPGSVERDRLRAFRDAGVNRLSLGIQAFQPGLLTTLGRVHDADDGRAAIAAARAAGKRHILPRGDRAHLSGTGD